MSRRLTKGVRYGPSVEVPSEFQTEAVRLVLTTDKPMAEVARDLGINYKTLGAWVRKEREQKTLAALPGALSEHERLELKRLRKEVADLKVEREILRKEVADLKVEREILRNAAAYFAKETTR